MNFKHIWHYVKSQGHKTELQDTLPLRDKTMLSPLPRPHRLRFHSPISKIWIRHWPVLLLWLWRRVAGGRLLVVGRPRRPDILTTDRPDEHKTERRLTASSGWPSLRHRYGRRVDQVRRRWSRARVGRVPVSRMHQHGLALSRLCRRGLRGGGGR